MAPLSLQLLLLLSAFTLASRPSNDTLTVCKALFSKYPTKFAWDPLGPYGSQTPKNASQYHTTTNDYWNIHSKDNRAACIFYPASAQDVSYAVKQLNQYQSVQYALHSGGHNSNLGYSSVDKGVQLSFKPNLASTVISSDRQTADVGPGSTWSQAVEELSKYNKCVVGGRLGHVGVGGYTLGGGLSFLTSQYGFASDTVTNFEVVLHNGTIANANATSNPDLFWALKGGGNAFAILTKITFKTFTIGQVWGGTRAYTADKHSALLSAVANYSKSYPDSKSAIIPTFNFGGPLELVKLSEVFYFYDGPNPPKDVFAQFDAIEAAQDKTKVQSYADLLNANNEFSISGFKYQIRENTFPVLPDGKFEEFLEYHYGQFEKRAFSQSLTQLDFQVLSFAIQPVPASLVKASNAMGQNTLGMKPSDGDRVFVEYDLSWINDICNDVCPQYIRMLAESVKQHHQQTYYGQKPTHWESGDVTFTNYAPTFMNDGMYDQNVYQSYGDENYQRLRTIAQAYDPNGFFATRQGGFKLQ